MKKTGKRIDGIFDAIYGQKMKGRWVKILITFFVFVMTIGVAVFLITKLGCSEKDGIYLKPWDVKVEIKKGPK